MSDTIIIGGGHNGLVAAYYLAKAGRRPLVLERQPFVGGGAVTTEIHPGFRCPSLSHELLIEQKVVADLNLARHGAEFIPLPALVCAPSSNGHAVVLHDDVAASVVALRSVMGARRWGGMACDAGTLANRTPVTTAATSETTTTRPSSAIDDARARPAGSMAVIAAMPQYEIASAVATAAAAGSNWGWGWGMPVGGGSRPVVEPRKF